MEISRWKELERLARHISYVLNQALQQMSPQLSAIPAETWEKALFGRTLEDPGSEPPVISLDDSLFVRDQAYEVAYDVDSLLAFPTGLGFAKSGIKYTPAPHMIQNITADLYVRIEHERTEGDQVRRSTLSIHQIPHLCLGRLVGFEDIMVFLLFPNVEVHGNFVALNQRTLARWTDRVLLPAIYAVLTASTLQHLPGNFEQSYAMARAKGAEMRRQERNVKSPQQLIHYFLQGEHLTEIWGRIQRLIQEPGLEDFAGVKIMMNAKNIKLLTKQPSLNAAWSRLMGQLAPVIDFDHLPADQLYVDLAKEICGTTSGLRGQDVDKECPASTLLWRTCCLRHQAEQLKGLYSGSTATVAIQPSDRAWEAPAHVVQVAPASSSDPSHDPSSSETDRDDGRSDSTRTVAGSDFRMVPESTAVKAPFGMDFYQQGYLRDAGNMTLTPH